MAELSPEERAAAEAEILALDRAGKLLTFAPHKYGKGSNPVPRWPRDFAVNAAEDAGQRPRQPPPDVLEPHGLVALGLRKPAGAEMPFAVFEPKPVARLSRRPS